jgi:hypothetical protein
MIPAAVGHTVSLPAPPLTSFFLPPPIDVHITMYTFIKFQSKDGSDEVGLIIRLNQELSTVTIRLFLSWTKLVELAGHDRVNNVSFWPSRNSTTPPLFLCNSDIVMDIAIASIKGLASVFYEDEIF